MKKHIDMRKQWDCLASENPFYSVASWDEFWGEEVDLELFWKSGREDVDRFIKKLNLADTCNLEMLELGCGIGRMTHRFSELFKHVYAIDVSPEMLKLARKYWGHLKNVEFILGNGADMRSIPNASVDFVFSYLVLQHAPYPEIVLSYIRETARVLKPNGTAFLQFRTHRSLVDRLRPLVYYLYLNLKKICLKELTPNESWYLTYEVWRGCSVAVSTVKRIANSVGLELESIENPGTQYTFLRFRKTGLLHKT